MRCKWNVGLALAVGSLLGGCASYRPAPLDGRAARAAWAARTASDEGLMAFARRLDDGARAPAGEAGFEPSDGLTLAEAEVVALFYNPALRVARLRTGVSKAQADHAGRWEDPVLALDAERVLASVDRPWIVGGTLDVTVPISGRLRAEKARAGAAHAAELARIAELEWATRSQLRREWLEWSAALERAVVLERSLARLDEVGGTVAKLVAAGELGRLDGRAFQMEAAARRVVLSEVRAKAADMELSIRGIMGLSPAAPLTLTPTLHEWRGSRTSVDEGALEDSPGLLVLAAEYGAAEHALRREVRAQYPDITIGPGASREEGEWRALLGFSLPIPLWNRNRGEVARAFAEREVARAAFEARLEELEIELGQARAAHDAARARRESLLRELIPLAEEQQRDAQRIAELGGFSMLLLLDSLERETVAREMLITARLEESLSAVRAAALTGPSFGPASAGPPLNSVETTPATGEQP